MQERSKPCVADSRSERRPQARTSFPDVRLGAHVGTALYREGDYVGTTVNIAARVTAQASRGQFLVTDAVRAALDGSVPLTPAGGRSLKGLSVAVEVFEVAGDAGERPADPVCGMLLDPGTCTVTAEWDDAAVLFCSDACRERFLADPQRYLPAAAKTGEPEAGFEPAT